MKKLISSIIEFLDKKINYDLPVEQRCWSIIFSCPYFPGCNRSFCKDLTCKCFLPIDNLQCKLKNKIIIIIIIIIIKSKTNKKTKKECVNIKLRIPQFTYYTISVYITKVPYMRTLIWEEFRNSIKNCSLMYKSISG